MTHALPPLERLLAVMARLRDKQRGCPWDVEQDFKTIAPYTIEEAYEVADAIEREDMAALKEELGDLLFQVVFHARMAEEAGAFDFHQVAAALAEKMIRRHPHVFGPSDLKAAEVRDSAAQTVAWEDHKASEREAKSGAGTLANSGTLGGVPLNLPALMRAQKLQRRAGRVGFDWNAPLPALDKLAEETAELRHEIAQAGPDPDKIEEEMGDMLFAAVNVARLAGVDAELALRRANAKFERRFAAVEAKLAARGRLPQQSTLAEMDALWDEAKAEERAAIAAARPRDLR
jgi:nucleoside triphosphate diphosphatase